MAWQSLGIRLLGELRVLHDGSEVELPASKKTRALLAYLVATGRSHGRERLCEWFWEGPADPRAALRWSLWKLRPLLESRGVPRLRANRAQVLFERRGANVDLLDLRALLDMGTQAASTLALEAADAAFEGDFLEGLDLPECYRFTEWCRSERESLRQYRLGILGELVTRLRATPERALAHARTRLLIDPLREESHRAVIELLLDLGRAPEAREQYAHCQQLIAAELGAPASRELLALRARLAPGAGSSAPTAPAAPTSAASTAPESGSHPPPLRGRARELAELVRSFDVTTAAGSAPTLLVGAPGVGKTRLLGELGRRVRELGGRVLWGRAHEAELLRPYAAWVRACGSLAQQELPQALRERLAPLLPEGGAAAPESSQEGLYAALGELVRELARAGPLLIVLDDVQWLDPASCALLDFALRAPAHPGVQFACAARSGELEDNLTAFRTCRALERAQRLRRWTLEPLDYEATAALVATLGCDPDAAAAVYAESRGNPLFSIELARARSAPGSATDNRLDDLIGERLERLPARARELLPWAACCPASFDLALLAEATGWAAADLASSALDLERHELLRANEQGYDFEHDLVREAAQRHTSPPLRRLIHRQLARALAQRLEREPALAGQVAYHASEAGDAELCASACLRAGQECIRLQAYSAAEALVTRGRHEASELPAERRIRLDMRLLKLLEAPALKKCAVRLRSEIALLCAEAQRAGMQAELKAGLELLGWVHLSEDPELLQSGRGSRALQALSRMYRGDVEQLVDGARCLALLEIDIPRAKALFSDLEAFGSSVTDTLLFQWGTGIVLRWEGDAQGARRALTRAASLAQARNDPWSEFECRSALISLELEVGQLQEAEAGGEALRRVASAIPPGGSEQSFADALEALLQLARGAAGAELRLARAGAALEGLSSSYLLAYFYTEQAQLRLAAGCLEEARHSAQRGLAAALVVDRRSEVARAHGLLAWVAWQRAELEQARLELDRARQCGSEFLTARTRGILADVAQGLGV